MQTYYDYGLKQWVTREASGTVRPATNAEALDAYSRGAQAPVGSQGPASPSTPAAPAAPRHVLYFDAATGQYSIDDGQGGRKQITGEQATTYAGQGWQINSPTTVGAKNPDGSPIGGGNPQPAPATPPAAPDWRTQQSWWGSLYPTGTLQRTAYDLNPDFAWNTMVNHQVANSASPEYQWLQGQQSRDYALYGDQNTRLAGTDDPARNMTFADWIEQNAPGFHQQFAQLSPNQKGYTDYYNPGGRMTF